MDPSQQPPTQDPTPSVPPTIPTPVPHPPQPPVFNQQPPLPPVAPLSTGKSSKKGLIIGGVVALLLAILAAVWFFVLSPMAQATKASNAFVKAAAAGDLEELYKIGDADSDASKEFLKAASESVNGNYELLEKGSKDKKYFFLYQFSNEKGKKGRTTVEKTDNGWVVTGFVFGSDNTALIPGEKQGESTDSAEDDSDSQAAAPTPAATTLACLIQDDYKWMNYNKEPDSVEYNTKLAGPTDFPANKSATMFFEPDSIEETSFSSIYDDWAEFAAKNVGKQWKFRLEGSTKGDDANTALDSSRKLANDRANEVKRELMSRGVAESRIVVDPPHDYSDEISQDDFNAEIFRRVSITIDPTCTSEATTAPASGR